MTGIGPVTDLGSVNGMQEWVAVDGEFEIGAEVRWTSFSRAMEEEIQVET